MRASCLLMNVAVSLVAASLAGCSAGPDAGTQQPGTVPLGTAAVSIDGRDATTNAAVSCETAGLITTVKTGDEQTGFTAVVASESSLVLQSISIRNLGGFTGSYNDGLGDPARAASTGRTYELSGIADGFEVDNPSFRKPGLFSIRVAC